MFPWTCVRPQFPELYLGIWIRSLCVLSAQLLNSWRAHGRQILPASGVRGPGPHSLLLLRQPTCAAERCAGIWASLAETLGPHVLSDPPTSMAISESGEEVVPGLDLWVQVP